MEHQRSEQIGMILMEYVLATFLKQNTRNMNSFHSTQIFRIYYLHLMFSEFFLSPFFAFILVPNVSFRVYAPGFLSRFMESHAVMFQGNAGLKPKEGEVTSRPWQWPINYRVSFICNY